MMKTMAEERAELLEHWEKDYQTGRLSEDFGAHAHRLLPNILDDLEAADALVKTITDAAVLLCDELGMSMPDVSVEFTTENIWGVVKTIRKLTENE